MGRLIDADALLKKFRYGEADTDNDKAWISTIRRMIKEQPTAYDIEKVVAELEEKADSIPIQYEYNYEKGFSDGIGDAIDIVKRGGAE